jgi:hypothetical protein
MRHGGAPIAPWQPTPEMQGLTGSPQFIPDGRNFIFTVTIGPQSLGEFIASLDEPSPRKLDAESLRINLGEDVDLKCMVRRATSWLIIRTIAN